MLLFAVFTLGYLFGVLMVFYVIKDDGEKDYTSFRVNNYQTLTKSGTLNDSWKIHGKLIEINDYQHQANPGRFNQTTAHSASQL